MTEEKRNPAVSADGAVLADGDGTAGELLIVSTLKARVGGSGRLVLTRKFVEGMNAYAAYWPGPVAVLVSTTDERESNLDPVEVDDATAQFRVEVLPDSVYEQAQRLSRAALVLASVVSKDICLAGLCRTAGVPVVCVSEHSLRTRKQMVEAATSNPLLRIRRKLWESRTERRLCKLAAQAVGIQCNGTPTFEAYARLNPRPLLFFDSRVTSDVVASQEEIRNRSEALLSGAPLRLAFSGRLIAMKGVDHLPVVAEELRRLGVPFMLDICGGGMLEQPIRHRIENAGMGDCVRLRGVLDFHTELVPFIKNSVDLFVCCHVQGDPSCTYLETMACGTPIAGYANEAFRGILKESGVGWATAMNKPRQLARLIAVLHRDRAALVRAAFEAREFAIQHTFENTFRRRVEHMLECCRAWRAGTGAAA